jgi:hypothetical protein
MKIKRLCLLHLQNINILSFLSVKLVSITTKVVSSSPVNAVVYSMQLLKCDKVAANLLFSPGTAVSSTKKTDRHDITEILLNVKVNTIPLTLTPNVVTYNIYSTFT